MHREELNAQLLTLLEQNTALTETVKRRTDEIHHRVVV